MFSFLNRGNQVENIVIAAMPKSASQSFITTFEKSYQDLYRIVRGKSGAGFGHNFLSYDKINSAKPNKLGMAIYGHYPLNSNNESVLSNFCVNKKAIVILRSLPDALISYYDHVEKKGRGPLDYRLLNYPEANSIWYKLSKKERLDFLIKYIAPWYISFTNSWFLSLRAGWTTGFVTFEEHTSDIKKALNGLDKKIQFSRSDDVDIPDGHQKTNFNVGLSGRGIKTFDKQQINEIKNMLKLLIDNQDLKKYLLQGGVLNCEQFELLD